MRMPPLIMKSILVTDNKRTHNHEDHAKIFSACLLAMVKPANPMTLANKVIGKYCTPCSFDIFFSFVMNIHLILYTPSCMKTMKGGWESYVFLKFKKHIKY